MLALGSAERATGRVERAAEAFQRATRLDPRSGAAWFNLGLAQRDQANARESALAFARAAELDPADFDAVQNVVTTLGAAVGRGERPFHPPDRPEGVRAKEGVSVIACSIDASRLARFERRMAAHLRDREHEVIVIRDAASLCEGYRRGWERSRQPIVAFCHDDFAILSDDPFDEVERVLGTADIVGLAGSTRASGPAVLWSGHPYIHGWIAHPAPDGNGLNAAILSLRAGVIGGMQTLDGVFMAMRREVPERVGFDAATFDGFHFYDLDFCHRAALSGLRLAVTTNIVGLHESVGRFDAEFERYAARFRAKFPDLAAPRGAHHWYEARLDDAAELLDLCGQLRGLVDAR